MLRRQSVSRVISPVLRRYSPSLVSLTKSSTSGLCQNKSLVANEGVKILQVRFHVHINSTFCRFNDLNDTSLQSREQNGQGYKHNNRGYCRTQSSHHFSSSTSPPSGNPTPSKKTEDKTPSSNKELPIQEVTLVDKLPPTLQPYARLIRLDKPIGTGLLLWPCYWSTAIAATPGSLPDPKLLGIFTIGAFAMRGAGCIINDMWDRDFDRHVARTKTRPLASGELNMYQATGFLALNLLGGLGALLSLPNTEYCFWLCSASLPLVTFYPAMKRITNLPQFFLGLTFNWGAFVGWAATYGDLYYPAVLPLYFSGVCWTIVYDTLYAHQDKLDDAKLGLKSTALYFGENTKPILYGFSALSFAGWASTGYFLEYTSPLYYAGCMAGWSHLLWQIRTAELDNPDNLAMRFRSNQQVGAIIFGSCVVGNFLNISGGNLMILS